MAFAADKTRQGAAGVSTGDYEIENSLRFNDDDSAELDRVPTTTSSVTKVTFSCWVKIGENSGTNGGNIVARGDGYSMCQFWNQTLYLGNDTYSVNTAAIFRDPSAWYHVVFVVDTTLATANDRMQIHVNGVRQAVGYFNNQPTQNSNFEWLNSASYTYNIGSRGASPYLDGYLAEVNFIDGQAKTTSDFGEEGIYGEWKPIEYAGTYTGNSFYLNFKGGGIIAATGGTVTTDGNYKVHSFTADGTFTPSSVPATYSYVEYLVIAGGGGGGGGHAGGGGAGGYRTGVLTVTAQAYSITVGDGGTAGDNSAGSSGAGGNGDNSVFSTITSTGGGGGGGRGNQDGKNGGSGGGSSEANAIGSGTAGQGNDGGTGANAGAYYGGGGGGGASAVGEDGTGAGGGDGGDGSSSSITGSAVTRGGGGGGGNAYGGAKSSGGTGGGGGGANTNVAGDNGSANTGGGAGGGYFSNSAGGAGGSGIVIIRYRFQ